jgi:hypothetical protein
MPTKRRVMTRTPSTWVERFVADGTVPGDDDRAGRYELNNVWCCGETIPGLPPYRSPEGKALVDQAVAKGWVPLR